MSASPIIIDRSKLIQFMFEDKAHRYLVANKRVLSSTQILSALGYVNYDMVPLEILEYKRQIGKLVHQACHFWDEDSKVLAPEEMKAWEASLPPEVQRRLAGYRKFRRDTGYEPTVNEGQFVGECYGMFYGMQFDSIGYCGSAPWLVDIKNASGAPKRAWGLQLASYAVGVKPFSLVPPSQYIRVNVQIDDPFPRDKEKRITVDQGIYKLHASSDPHSKIYQANDFQLWPAILSVAIDMDNHRLLETR